MVGPYIRMQSMARAKWRLLYGFAGILAALLLTWWSNQDHHAEAGQQRPQDRPPSILLVTIDTWRWDYLGASGAGKVATPFLDRLAAQGLYLHKVQATCPLTTPSHASILTGLVPYRHGIRDNVHFRLKPGIDTLASLLKRAGYHTIAVVSGSPLRSIYGLDRGFDIYDDAGLADSRTPFVPGQRTGDETTRRALSHLQDGARGRPVFVWVHYYDPHFPYVPPEPFRSRYRNNPYAGEVAFTDEQARLLFEGLPANSGRKWVVLVTGDHGESLGEHGELTHGLTLYESAIEVPLILHPRPSVRRTSLQPASLVDVFPTLCSLAGVASAPGDGRSLFAPSDASRYLTAETAFPTLGFGFNPVLLLRRSATVWMHHGAEEVYDLASDPAELRDLSSLAAGRKFIQETSPLMRPSFGEDPAVSILKETVTPSAEEQEMMRSLGYLGGSRPTGSRTRSIDIRTFLPDFQRLSEARVLVSQGRYQEAFDHYQAFVNRYPDSSLALQEMGSVASSLKKYPEAFQAFSKALAMDPQDAVAAINMGHLSMRKGELQQAAQYYERTLAIDPQQATAHLNLGLLYAEPLNQPSKAAEHLRLFLQLAPQAPEAPEVRALLEKLERSRNPR